MVLRSFARNGRRRQPAGRKSIAPRFIAAEPRTPGHQSRQGRHKTQVQPTPAPGRSLSSLSGFGPNSIPCPAMKRWAFLGRPIRDWAVMIDGSKHPVSYPGAALFQSKQRRIFPLQPSASDLQMSASEWERSAPEIQKPTPVFEMRATENQMWTSVFQMWTSDIEMSASDIEMSASDIEMSASELQMSASEFQMSKAEFQMSLADLQLGQPIFLNTSLKSRQRDGARLCRRPAAAGLNSGAAAAGRGRHSRAPMRNAGRLSSSLPPW